MTVPPSSGALMSLTAPSAVLSSPEPEALARSSRANRGLRAGLIIPFRRVNAAGYTSVSSTGSAISTRASTSFAPPPPLLPLSQLLTLQAPHRSHSPPWRNEVVRWCRCICLFFCLPFLLRYFVFARLLSQLPYARRLLAVVQETNSTWEDAVSLSRKM